MLVVSVESDQPDLTPTVCGRQYCQKHFLFIEMQISGTDPGLATETRRTGLDATGENRKTITEDQEMGKLAKLRG